MKRRAPALARQDWKGARQGAGGDDVAGCERRIDRIAREQGDEMAQRRQRAVEDIGAMAAIDHGTIAQQIDLETCEIGSPIGGAAEARRMAWREQQYAVQAIDDDGVGGRELPARKNRVNDLEAPATQSMQSNSAVSSISGEGAAARRNTISGSMRGSAKGASVNGCCAAWRGGGRSRTVVSNTNPHIGAYTPYSDQMVRLVKPILRPMTRSPRAVRNAHRRAEMR